MRTLGHLFDANRAWAAAQRSRDPELFSRLAEEQNPEYLWIGCSDSRVPANEIVDLPPGEMFVHRNVANVVVQTDLNCLSVLQFAVEALRVRHVIVCGHYRCGGVRAAAAGTRLGLVENWLRHVQDVISKHEAALAPIADEAERLDRLCELNVIEQVASVARTTVVQSAWQRGQDLAVHGWIYDIGDGLLRDLSLCVTEPDELSPLLTEAVARRFSEGRPAAG